MPETATSQLAGPAASVPGRDALMDFERRARKHLDFALPADVFDGGSRHGGDHRLDGLPAFAGPPRAAAVLVPIVAHHEAATVLLTTRLRSLRQHSGQIAFPGGKIDAEDTSPRAAALRETFEEIGLGPEAVVPLGYLDPHLTGTGFMVVPTVALVTPPLCLTLNPLEVDDAFEVPLAFVMDPRNHHHESREIAGRMRRFHAMPFGERHIWGATAGILRNLYERLYC